MKGLNHDDDDNDDDSDRDTICNEFGPHAFYRDSSQVEEFAMIVCLLDNDSDGDDDDDNDNEHWSCFDDLL